MPIRSWPTQEQPREKLLSLGADQLSDAELLAIFLRTGVAGRSAVDLGRDLIHQFGGLRALLKADQQTFCACHGLGPAKYAQLQAVLTLAKRELADSMKRDAAISNPEQARILLRRHLRNQPREVFSCLWLDTRHRLLALEDLFYGTINAASVYPREVVRAGMRHNAAAAILAHNHPSGVAEPSQADRQLTIRLAQALSLVDIRVLDHIVVGDDHCVSFADRGLI